MDWTVKIENVSNVDSLGKFSIEYSILVDGQTKYPPVVIIVSSEAEAKRMMQERINEMKIVEQERNKFNIGDVITF